MFQGDIFVCNYEVLIFDWYDNTSPVKNSKKNNVNTARILNLKAY